MNSTESLSQVHLPPSTEADFSAESLDEGVQSRSIPIVQRYQGRLKTLSHLADIAKDKTSPPPTFTTRSAVPTMKSYGQPDVTGAAPVVVPNKKSADVPVLRPHIQAKLLALAAQLGKWVANGKDDPNVNVAARQKVADAILETAKSGRYALTIQGKIGALPPIGLNRIKTLTISDTNIKDFSEIGSLTSLRTVEISDNANLTSLKGMHGKYPNLRRIDLWENGQLTSMEGFPDAPKLQTLCVQKCPVKGVSELTNPHTLEELILEGTAITSISNLPKMPLLDGFMLYHSKKLLTVPADLYQKIPSVRKLALSQCGLNSFDFKCVDHLPNLRFLDLERNDIKSVEPPQKLRNAPLDVRIGDNPIYADRNRNEAWTNLNSIKEINLNTTERVYNSFPRPKMLPDAVAETFPEERRLWVDFTNEPGADTLGLIIGGRNFSGLNKDRLRIILDRMIVNSAVRERVYKSCAPLKGRENSPEEILKKMGEACRIDVEKW